MANLLEPPLPSGHADHRSWQKDIPWASVRHAWRHTHRVRESQTEPGTFVHIGPDPESREGHTLSIVTDARKSGILTVWRNPPGLSESDIMARQKADASSALASKTKTNASKADQKQKQLERAHASHPPTKKCPLCK